MRFGTRSPAGRLDVATLTARFTHLTTVGLLPPDTCGKVLHEACRTWQSAIGRSAWKRALRTLSALNAIGGNYFFFLIPPLLFTLFFFFIITGHPLSA